MNDTTAVAVSGGVDSLMAAYLLKQQGHNIIGIHFLTGYESESINISEIAGQIDIPIKVLNIQDAFNTEVVDYFIKTYLNGKTPNPCLVCNPVIKFGVLFEYARKLGSTRIATGHYARIKKDSAGRYHLLRGVDQGKDQSYFLAFLTCEHLSRACFPLGNMTKSDVKKRAVTNGLHPVTRSESQDVCFIKGQNYGDFLARKVGYTPEAGDIVDRSGTVLGRHPGLHLFTVGQRRGINCPASEPYYVLRLDTDRNRLVVGHKNDTLLSECRVDMINWIQPAPQEPVRIHTRVRYRHEAAPSTLVPLEGNKASVQFDRPQSAITPGQGAVFFVGEEVIGGGIIT